MSSSVCEASGPPRCSHQGCFMPYLPTTLLPWGLFPHSSPKKMALGSCWWSSVTFEPHPDPSPWPRRCDLAPTSATFTSHLHTRTLPLPRQPPLRLAHGQRPCPRRTPYSSHWGSPCPDFCRVGCLSSGFQLHCPLLREPFLDHLSSQSVSQQVSFLLCPWYIS